MPKKITGFSLDEDVFIGVRELATEDDRTLSNYVNIILTKHLKKVGYKKPAPKKRTLIRRRKK